MRARSHRQIASGRWNARCHTRILRRFTTYRCTIGKERIFLCCNPMRTQPPRKTRTGPARDGDGMTSFMDALSNERVKTNCPSHFIEICSTFSSREPDLVYCRYKLRAVGDSDPPEQNREMKFQNRRRCARPALHKTPSSEDPTTSRATDDLRAFRCAGPGALRRPRRDRTPYPLQGTPVVAAVFPQTLFQKR